MDPAVLSSLLSSGPMGILLALVVFWAYKLQGRLSDSEAQRVSDAEQAAERALLLSDRIHTAIDKLSEIAEALAAIPQRGGLRRDTRKKGPSL